MSDLISRSELINALKVHFDSCFREDGELLYSDHICTSDDVVDLIKLVENQPTAYSVDKVVEELEERSKEYNSGLRLHGKPEEMRTDEAIEIVKQGGVSDDVCEWKDYKDGIEHSYHIGCCEEAFSQCYETDFKFCPYCGKKIKVVE